MTGRIEYPCCNTSHKEGRKCPIHEKDRIREKVFQAIGEASMCWSETPKGIFESSRAEKIGEELLSDIKQEILGKLPEKKERTKENIMLKIVEFENAYKADGWFDGFNDCLAQVKKIIEDEAQVKKLES